jgi:hypothetical protein
MTAEYPQGDEPLIPMPALSLPALRQAVATVAPSRLPEFFQEIQDAFTQAGNEDSVFPIRHFYQRWGAAIAIERRPSVAARLHAAERALADPGNSFPGVLPDLPWRRRTPDCIVPPETAPAATGLCCTSCHAALAWVGSAGGWRRRCVGRSPLIAHAAESDRIKPAMRQQERPRICGGSVGSGRGYRNSPEMRLTEPATMTTPNT